MTQIQASQSASPLLNGPQSAPSAKSAARTGREGDAWLVAALLTPGDPQRSWETAWALLAEAGGDIGRLSRRSAAELRASAAEGSSLGQAAAVRIEAAFELGRRVERRGGLDRPCLRSPGSVQRLLAPELRGLEREAFYVLLVDSKHRLKRSEVVSLGTLTTSLVHPREVFRPAIREAAAAVVVAHNHPSGDPEPSAEDLEVTRRLVEAGKTLGIPLLDHVVLGEGTRYVSLRERMGF